MRAPDYMGPLVGWRAWRCGSDGALASIHHPTRWLPGVPVEAGHSPPLLRGEEDEVPEARAASRAGSPHSVPGADCTCGIYALRDRESLGLQFLWPSMPAVWGRVSLWGRVVVADKGYRAQFAYPAELWTAAEAVAAVLDAFRVPVHLVTGEEV